MLNPFRRVEPETAVEPDLVAEASATSRRDRAVRAGSELVVDGLGQKVMYGWLQNRHQTLVPLTLNFRVLSAEQRGLIAGASAALLLAGRPRAEAEAAAPGVHTWLESLGADPAVIALFEQALLGPPPLDQVFERTLELDVSVYVYVAGLAVSDPRFPASVLLCDVLQARFDLPTAIIRTVVRRYRR